MQAHSSTGDSVAADPADRSSSRRDLIKRAAQVSAVAWTVPLVIDGISNPAAAATCAKGNFWVAFELALSTTASAATCTTNAGYVNTTPAAVALTAVFTGTAPTGGTNGSIAHVASTGGNAQPVKLTIAGCSCSIVRVMGVVHRRGPASVPTDCPAPACVDAATGATTAYLLISAGAIGTTTLTVGPNFTSTLCPDPPGPITGGPGIHWGSPATPNGKLVVEVKCG